MVTSCHTKVRRKTDVQWFLLIKVETDSLQMRKKPVNEGRLLTIAHVTERFSNIYLSFVRDMQQGTGWMYWLSVVYMIL